MVVPGRVVSQAQAGSCSPASREQGSPCSPREQTNRPFCENNSRWLDSLVVLVSVSQAHWYSGQGATCQAKTFLLPRLSFLFSRGRRLTPVTSSPEVQQLSTNP